MNATEIDPRTEQFGFRTDCRHCVADRKDCGRAHYPNLSYEWESGTGREVVQEKLASEKQVSFLRKLLAEKELTDRKRANRVAKLDSGEVTAKEAKTLIEELLVLPQRKVGGPRPSTRQLDFIKKLIGEKDLTGTAFASWNDGVLASVSKGEVSSAIDQLMALPRAASKAITEDGMYKIGDEIFKVQVAVHGSGRLYAKKLVHSDFEFDLQHGGKPERWSFEYAPGAVQKLRPENRMTLEEAQRFGRLYGVCCVCGRVLTNEDSIEAGIGPICGKNL